ncbi:MAG TPA: hypothetical protein PKK43_00835 [Spirochaetota bacterium]|nr:hypothetical protein [Spirochaetota bacterium]
MEPDIERMTVRDAIAVSAKSSGMSIPVARTVLCLAMRLRSNEEIIRIVNARHYMRGKGCGFKRKISVFIRDYVRCYDGEGFARFCRENGLGIGQGLVKTDRGAASHHRVLFVVFLRERCAVTLCEYCRASGAVRCAEDTEIQKED